MTKLLSITSAALAIMLVSSYDVAAADKPVPFQGVFPFGNIAGFETIYVVPSGEQAEVQYVSARLHVSGTVNVPTEGYYLRMNVSFEGTEAEIEIPFEETANGWYVVSEEILLHTDTDVDILPNASCSGGGTVCNIDAVISGFVADK